MKSSISCAVVGANGNIRRMFLSPFRYEIPNSRVEMVLHRNVVLSRVFGEQCSTRHFPAHLCAFRNVPRIDIP